MEICEGCGARDGADHDGLCQARNPDVVCGHAVGSAFCANKRPCDEHDIARARYLLQAAIGYINPAGVGDTLIGQAQRAARRVAELSDMVNEVTIRRNTEQRQFEKDSERYTREAKRYLRDVEVLTADRDDAKRRAEAHSASIAKMCDERAALIRTAEEASKVAADALSARDAVFAELQAIREATMLDPPSDDWSKITAAHVRQHVQDLGDNLDRAIAQRNAAEKSRGEQATKIAAIVRSMSVLDLGKYQPVEDDVAHLVSEFKANVQRTLDLERTISVLKADIIQTRRDAMDFRRKHDELAEEMTRGASPESVIAAAEKLSAVDAADADADAVPAFECRRVDGSQPAFLDAVIAETANLAFEWLTGEKIPRSK